MPDVRMDYQAIDDNIAKLNAMAAKLTDIQTQVRGAGTSVDTALQGKAGDALRNAVNGRLVAAIGELSQRLKIAAGDLQSAQQDFKVADQQTQSEIV